MAAAKKTATMADAFENVTMSTPEAFKEGYEKFAEGVTTIAEFQKKSMEAMMASFGAFTKGVEKITSENTAFAKAAFEESMATAKAAATSKSFQEAIEMNTKFVRESAEKNLGQANKIATLWAETTKETTEPLTAHYGELVEKVQSYRV